MLSSQQVVQIRGYTVKQNPSRNVSVLYPQETKFYTFLVCNQTLDIGLINIALHLDGIRSGGFAPLVGEILPSDDALKKTGHAHALWNWTSEDTFTECAEVVSRVWNTYGSPIRPRFRSITIVLDIRHRGEAEAFHVDLMSEPQSVASSCVPTDIEPSSTSLVQEISDSASILPTNTLTNGYSVSIVPTDFQPSSTTPTNSVQEIGNVGCDSELGGAVPAAFILGVVIGVAPSAVYIIIYLIKRFNPRCRSSVHSKTPETTSNQEPVAKTSNQVEIPSQGPVVETPSQKPVAKTPGQETLAKTPSQEPVAAKTPDQEPVAKTPSQEPAPGQEKTPDQTRRPRHLPPLTRDNCSQT
jgi:hypothetical protein